MLDTPLSWITIHRLRYAVPVDAKDGGMPGPAGASLVLIGPETRMDANGVPQSSNDVWGGIAFYSDREAAEAAFDARETIPGCESAVEAWHGLLCPISHRGETAWFGALDNAGRFQPAGAGNDPGGRLIVLTSAGFNGQTPEEIKADMPRRIDFLRNVERVASWYRSLPSNMAAATFALRLMGHVDGLTVSVWESDAAMMGAAYKSGFHRSQLDRYKAEQTADRSSFTRTRLIRAKGTWNGAALA